MSRAICDLLATLNPGTPMENIIINGYTVTVENFVSFNEDAERVVFKVSDDKFLIVDCNRIGSVEFRAL
ncbi:hypothetical protein MTP04_25890 [Lysinibacillus sp. PLM2]|nr:hypothetical protein MTP04_25890 [Lysinibacillus sp. PLM2]